MIDQDDRRALASIFVLATLCMAGVLLASLTLAVAWRLFEFVTGV